MKAYLFKAISSVDDFVLSNTPFTAKNNEDAVKQVIDYALEYGKHFPKGTKYIVAALTLGPLNLDYQPVDSILFDSSDLDSSLVPDGYTDAVLSQLSRTPV